ncbi:MAG: DNA-directed RNA polymerase subunit F [Methanobacteriota archaeon]|nr:MAG: DNA-directed RNA polymerase subunit F [Euryarchaeota archaeon]
MPIKKSLIRPVTLAEVREILEERAKEGDLTYEQRLTLDYARKFAKIDHEKAKKLVSEIMKVDDRITHEQAVKIVDILPETIEEVRLVFSTGRYQLETEKVNQIVEIIKKFRSS